MIADGPPPQPIPPDAPAAPPAEPLAAPAAAGTAPAEIEDSPDPAGVLRILLFAFFCSGVAGLVYEVVWARRLTLIFGSTSLAISTVLAAYMAGLAFGSWAIGRLADRVGRRVQFYARLEIAIGLYGLATPWLFTGLEALYRPLYHALDLSLGPSLALRFSLAFLVLLVPTFFMGGTLPILSKYLVDRESTLGRRLGLLYSTNTLGAVCGVLITGFVLIPTLGVTWTIWTAAWINIWVGLLVLLLARSGRLPADAAAPAAPPAATVITVEPSAAAAPVPVAGAAAHRVVVLVFAAAGFASFLYEVSWTRILGLVTGSATNAFTVMLASFLFGIALGSWLVSRWIDERKDLIRVLAGVELTLAVLTALLIPAFGFLPGLFVHAFPHIRHSYTLVMGYHTLTALGTMLLPTLLIGATFPIVAKIYARGTGSLGRRVGEVYVANTLGGILGSVAAGFLLVPWLTSPGTSLVGSVLNLACAAALYAVSPSLALPGRLLGALGALLLTGPVLLAGSYWDRARMTSGVYVYAAAYRNQKNLFEVVSDPQVLLFYEEGMNCLTTVRQYEEGTRLLQINGKTDASNRDDMVTQVLCGYWPMVLAPRRDDVLVVGLGCGVSASVASRFDCRRMDVVEIEQSIVNASEKFADVNHRVLEDPRVTLVVEDARNFVALTRKRYDVIVSEPSNPWTAGSSTLFTVEHFRNLAAVLREEGVIGQWVQSYAMDTALVKSVFRTFQEVFPHGFLVSDPAGTNDFIMIGSRRPLRIREADLRRTLGMPGLREDLAALEYTQPIELLATVACTERDFREYAQAGELNTDDYPIVEFETPKFIYRYGLPIFLDLAKSMRELEPPVEWEGERRAAELYRLRAARHERAGQPLPAIAVLKRAAELEPRDVALKLALGAAAVNVARAHEGRLWRLEQERRAGGGGSGGEGGAGDEDRRLLSGIQEVRAVIPELLELSVHAYRGALEVDPTCRAAHLALGERALSQGKFAEAEQHLAAATAAGETGAAGAGAGGGGGASAQAWNNLAVARLSLGKPAEAEAALRTGLLLDGENPALLENLATALTRQGKRAEALTLFDRLLAMPLPPPEIGRIRRLRAGAAAAPEAGPGTGPGPGTGGTK
ncbi:MAG: fused MFS/spermidine synthase [Planctomycetes bacterium]|nr:fused MFS/spermidine synthase [Planctomycetota bacterium]